MHYGYCECGKKSTTAEDHTWTQGKLVDVCELCGINKDHVHSYTYTSCKDGKTHKVSCGCGYVKFEQCLVMTGEGVLPRCLKCNQRLSGNIIIPLEDDDDDENDVMFFKEDGIEEETE